MDEVGDYDKRGKDLWQQYATFGRKTLSEELHSHLQLARRFSVEGAPEHGHKGAGDGFVGDKVWLALISGVRIYDKQIYEWAMGFAEVLASCKSGGKHSPRLIRSYRTDWGDEAACDGVDIVLFGVKACGIKARAERYGLSYQPYTKIRNYVAGCLLEQAARFESDLAYARRADRFT